MGKAIFVLDEMPKACQSGYTKERLDCPLFHDDYYCMGAYKNVIKNFDGICDEARPDWCPLKEVPRRHDGSHLTREEFENIPSDDMILKFGADMMDIGWDSCLDMILGTED